MKRRLTIVFTIAILALAFASCTPAYLGIWSYSYSDSADGQDRYIELAEDGTFNYVVMESPNFTNVDAYYYGSYSVSGSTITLECEKVSDGSQDPDSTSVTRYDWEDTSEEIEVTFAKDGKNLKLTFVADEVTISMTETENVFSTIRAIEAVQGL